MHKSIVGRRVKLARRAKRALNRASGGPSHWREFFRQRGTVIAPIESPEGYFWPEIHVLWDSGFRYLYKREHLDVLP